MTATETKLIETKRREGQYGMKYSVAIIEHESLGRILIREGWRNHLVAGVHGETYSWSMGAAYRCDSEDTIDSLYADQMDEKIGPWSKIDVLDPMTLSGNAINGIARSLGI